MAGSGRDAWGFLRGGLGVLAGVVGRAGRFADGRDAVAGFLGDVAFAFVLAAPLFFEAAGVDFAGAFGVGGFATILRAADAVDFVFFFVSTFFAFFFTAGPLAERVVFAGARLAAADVFTAVAFFAAFFGVFFAAGLAAPRAATFFCAALAVAGVFAVFFTTFPAFFAATFLLAEFVDARLTAAAFVFRTGGFAMSGLSSGLRL